MAAVRRIDADVHANLVAIPPPLVTPLPAHAVVAIHPGLAQVPALPAVPLTRPDVDALVLAEEHAADMVAAGVAGALALSLALALAGGVPADAVFALALALAFPRRADLAFALGRRGALALALALALAKARPSSARSALPFGPVPRRSAHAGAAGIEVGPGAAGARRACDARHRPRRRQDQS